MSSYRLPRNLRKKSVQSCVSWRTPGCMAYVGAESGDDEVLARVNKGETYESTLSALDKLGQAGITRSVMILNGLGGRALSRQHARNSARLMNAAQPEFLSTLVVSFPQGDGRFRRDMNFEPLPLSDLLVELEGCWVIFSCVTRCSAATTPPTIWCSKARWEPTSRA